MPRKNLSEAQASDRMRRARNKTPKISRSAKAVNAVTSAATATASSVASAVSSIGLPNLPQASSSTSQPFPGLALSKPTQFAASNYLVSNLWEVNESIPVLDENQYRERLGKIKGQQRAVEVVQENLKLNRSLLKAEGLSIEAQTEYTNNQIKAQDLTTAGVKLQQSQTKTGIETAKLSAMGHDLRGYQSEAILKGETWDLKLEGLQLGIDQARAMLSAKKAEFELQFPTLIKAS